MPRTATLRVNPVACSGHGLCAELLPELVKLDEWGYPVLPAEPVPPSLLSAARRAVSSCPALALAMGAPLTSGGYRRRGYSEEAQTLAGVTAPMLKE